MKIEMRWLQIAPGNRVLQFKEAYYENWQNVPVVLEVNEQSTLDSTSRAHMRIGDPTYFGEGEQ